MWLEPRGGIHCTVTTAAGFGPLCFIGKINFSSISAKLNGSKSDIVYGAASGRVGMDNLFFISEGLTRRGRATAPGTGVLNKILNQGFNFASSQSDWYRQL